jgi:hypothetical protein
MRKLSLEDIKDLRAYERERDELRTRIIDTKKRHRFDLGEIISLTFETTDTMRFQVQEMARAERMLTDEQIQHELDTYNQLIPDDGELSASLFIELTSREQMMEWLPKLVGIQRAVLFRFDGVEVRAEPMDEERLTREEVTAAVHFLKFRLPPDVVPKLGAGPVVLAIDHPNYQAEVTLTDEQRQTLLADLRG